MKVSSLLRGSGWGILLIFCGCVSTEYSGKSFAATASLQVLTRPAQPSEWVFIGTGNASGEYSGTTNAELQQKLFKLGLQHGAEAMKIAGVRLVPENHVVNMAEYNYIEATDDPDQTWTETDMQETISNDPNAGYTRYRRIMYAEYYRKKTSEKP